MNLNSTKCLIAAAACTTLLFTSGCKDDESATTNKVGVAAVAPATSNTETKVIIREVEVEREPNCSNCGEVVAITAIQVDGGSSGGGAAIGAVIGGVIGHQFGSGSGNDAATAGGAIGGAVAGNEIEKKRNASTEYEVTVALENGGSRTVRMQQTGSINTGDRVRVAGNTVIKMP